jgi:hypothetical protein
MQSEMFHAFRSSRQNAAMPSAGESAPPALAGGRAEIRQDAVWYANGEQELRGVASASRDIAITFLRLANLDNDIVDRLSRYEAALWRQLARRSSPFKPSSADSPVRPSSQKLASFRNSSRSSPQGVPPPAAHVPRGPHFAKRSQSRDRLWN